MSGSANQLDPELLAVLVCPSTRQPLQLSSEGDALLSASAGLSYPVRGGVAVLLVEQASRIQANIP